MQFLSLYNVLPVINYLILLELKISKFAEYWHVNYEMTENV